MSRHTALPAPEAVRPRRPYVRLGDLERNLAARVDGEVRFDPGSRGAYPTGGPFHLARALVGSEGTLVTVLRAELCTGRSPRPPSRGPRPVTSGPVPSPPLRRRSLGADGPAAQRECRRRRAVIAARASFRGASRNAR